jgi:transcriptional regulator with XRE-family HTH domain
MLGKRLVDLRKRAGLTQQELAERLYISRDTYAQYEIDRRNPDYETLTSIARFHNVSVDYILGLTDDPRPVDDIKKEKNPDLDSPLRQKSLAEAFYKISEMSWEFDLDTETMHMLIDKAVAKFGPPPHMEKGGIAAHGPSLPGTGIFDKEDDDD